MRAALLILLLVDMMGCAMAQTLYRYTTKDGQVGFTDDPQHIPADATREAASIPAPNAVVSSGKGDHEGNATALSQGTASPLNEILSGHEVRFTTPLDQDNPRRLMVPVVIRQNGHAKRLQLVYDTGAPGLILNRKVAKALGLKAVRSVHGQLSAADNKRWVTESSAPVSVQIGPVVIDHVMASWYEEADYLGPPWDEDGLLGMDLISRFRTEVDRSNGAVMRWTVLNRDNMRIRSGS